MGIGNGGSLRDSGGRRADLTMSVGMDRRISAGCSQPVALGEET